LPTNYTINGAIASTLPPNSGERVSTYVYRRYYYSGCVVKFMCICM